MESIQWSPKKSNLQKNFNFSKNYQEMFAIVKKGKKCRNFDERRQVKVFLDPLKEMKLGVEALVELELEDPEYSSTLQAI